METPKRRRSWLTGLALGMLLALLIAPATRWIVRMQMTMQALPPGPPYVLHYLGVKEMPPLFGGWSEADTIGAQRITAAVAARHPNDFQLQLASALQTPVPSSAGPGIHYNSLRVFDREQIRPLLARFPNNPSVHAQFLRFATMGGIASHREENYLLEGRPVPAEQLKTGGKGSLSPEQLADFDRSAAEGERLDPANAYFPVMRAIGLLEARRDDEAVAALLRAAEKPHWEDYTADEVNGQWRMLSEGFGDHGALPRTCFAAAVLFPHYAPCRSLARVMTYKAIEAEKEGRVEEGLAIRRALLHVGGVMRAESRPLIGALVGIAIAAIPRSRPGGAPALKQSDKISAEESKRMRQEDYYAYLRRIGHAEEARRAEAEYRAGDEARDILHRLQKADAMTLNGLGRVIAWWMAGVSTLSAAVWLLLLGGAAALLMRNRRLRAGQPLPDDARRGIGSGLLALLFGAALAIALQECDVPLFLFSVPILLLGAFCFFTRGSRALVAFAATLIAVPLAAALFVWQARGSLGYMGSMVTVLQNMMSGEGESATLLPLMGLLAGLLPLALLPLTALVLGVISLACRVPLSVGLVRGFRGVAVPLASVLILVYGGLVFGTAREEARENYSLERRLQHEGRYFAEIARQEWPGAPQ